MTHERAHRRHDQFNSKFLVLIALPHSLRECRCDSGAWTPGSTFKVLCSRDALFALDFLSQGIARMQVLVIKAKAFGASSGTHTLKGI